MGEEVGGEKARPFRGWAKEGETRSVPEVK